MATHKRQTHDQNVGNLIETLNSQFHNAQKKTSLKEITHVVATDYEYIISCGNKQAGNDADVITGGGHKQVPSSAVNSTTALYNNYGGEVIYDNHEHKQSSTIHHGPEQSYNTSDMRHHGDVMQHNWFNHGSLHSTPYILNERGYDKTYKDGYHRDSITGRDILDYHGETGYRHGEPTYLPRSAYLQELRSDYLPETPELSFQGGQGDYDSYQRENYDRVRVEDGRYSEYGRDPHYGEQEDYTRYDDGQQNYSDLYSSEKQMPYQERKGRCADTCTDIQGNRIPGVMSYAHCNYNTVDRDYDSNVNDTNSNLNVNDSRFTVSEEPNQEDIILFDEIQAYAEKAYGESPFGNSKSSTAISKSSTAIAYSQAAIDSSSHSSDESASSSAEDHNHHGGDRSSSSSIDANPEKEFFDFTPDITRDMQTHPQLSRINTTTSIVTNNIVTNQGNCDATNTHTLNTDGSTSKTDHPDSNVLQQKLTAFLQDARRREAEDESSPPMENQIELTQESQIHIMPPSSEVPPPPPQAEYLDGEFDTQYPEVPSKSTGATPNNAVTRAKNRETSNHISNVEEPLSASTNYSQKNQHNQQAQVYTPHTGNQASQQNARETETGNQRRNGSRVAANKPNSQSQRRSQQPNSQDGNTQANSQQDGNVPQQASGESQQQTEVSKMYFSKSSGEHQQQTKASKTYFSKSSGEHQQQTKVSKTYFSKSSAEHQHQTKNSKKGYRRGAPPPPPPPAPFQSTPVVVPTPPRAKAGNVVVPTPPQTQRNESHSHAHNSSGNNHVHSGVNQHANTHVSSQQRGSSHPHHDTRYQQGNNGVNALQGHGASGKSYTGKNEQYGKGNGKHANQGSKGDQSHNSRNRYGAPNESAVPPPPPPPPNYFGKGVAGQQHGAVNRNVQQDGESPGVQGNQTGQTQSQEQRQSHPLRLVSYLCYDPKPNVDSSGSERSNYTNNYANGRCMELFRNDLDILYESLFSLYDDRIFPEEKALKARIHQRAGNANDGGGSELLKHHFMDLYEILPGYSVTRAANGVTFVLLKSGLEGFKGWIDPTSDVDPFTPDLWKKFEEYLQKLVSRKASLAFQSIRGRYGLAYDMRNDSLFDDYSLGELCHIVELAIKRKLLAYDQNVLLPAAISTSLRNARFGMPTLRNSQDHNYVRGLEELADCVKALLRKYPEGFNLSTLKTKIRHYFKRNLSETVFGETKLLTLFTRPPLDEACDVTILTNNKNGHFIVRKGSAAQYL